MGYLKQPLHFVLSILDLKKLFIQYKPNVCLLLIISFLEMVAIGKSSLFHKRVTHTPIDTTKKLVSMMDNLTPSPLYIAALLKRFTASLVFYNNESIICP